jgi:Concanavalin A-like lectin/glucanases superfamily
MTQSHLRLLCILIVAGFLVMGLWPFNFAPRNQIERLPGENAIHFKPLSLVVSEGALDLGNTSAPSSAPGTFTLELLLAADREPNRNLPVILSLYNGELPESLLVGQWKSSLLLRIPAREAQARRKYRETGVEGALQKDRRRFIAITSGPEGTLFYVDGILADSNPKVFVRPEDLRGRLILGDSPRGGSGWTGKLFGLAAFNRPLDASEVLRHYQLWTGRRGGRRHGVISFRIGRGADDTGSIPLSECAVDPRILLRRSQNRPVSSLGRGSLSLG